ncbi:PEP-CTERM sorting domain-containing protein [Aeoliella sp.]|uniref:PEP-CTERM sorting domain-containing protein n=1 Tax=Aeoliella sp. TaxID=2795800 RepID=UPI003CCB984A
MRFIATINLLLLAIAIQQTRAQGAVYVWDQPAFGQFDAASSWTLYPGGVPAGGPESGDSVVFGFTQSTTLQEISVLHVVDSFSEDAWVFSGEYEFRFGNPNLTYSLGELTLGGGDGEVLDGQPVAVGINPPSGDANLRVGIPQFSSPGTVVSSRVTIGGPPPAGDPVRAGTLTLSGAGNLWHNTGPTIEEGGRTFIGAYGNEGVLRVESGAVFQNDFDLSVGGGTRREKGIPEIGTGHLYVDGVGSQVQADTIEVGARAGDPDANFETEGEVEVTGGALLDVQRMIVGDPLRGITGLATQPSRVAIGSPLDPPLSPISTASIGTSLTIDHSTASISVADSGRVTVGSATELDGAVSVGSGGSLRGVGTVFGNVVVANTGLINPGTSMSPGTLNVDGDVTLGTDARLFVMLGGTLAGSEFDALDATGTASLGGQLIVSLEDGYVPGPNDIYRILTGSAISGDFASTDLPPLPDDYKWRVVRDDSNGFVDLWAFTPLDNNWTDPFGGSFQAASNWSQGEVADEDDVAVFNLDAAYEVHLESDANSYRTQVRAGEVTVDLDGHTWTIQSGDFFMPHLVVGLESGDDAELRLTGGALITSTVDIAADSNSTGVMHVTGQSASLTMDDRLTVGERGTGELLVNQGAQVNIWRFNVGNFDTSNGTATVSGVSSELNVETDIDVGDEGVGELHITDGATVSNDDATIGNDGVGTVFVGGAGTVWTNAGDLKVGEDGQGELTIADGAMVFNDTASIAEDPGSGGDVYVNGASSTWGNSGSLRVGGDSFGSGGDGLLQVDGGLVTVEETLQIWESGTVRLEDGAISASDVNVVASGELELLGGTLSFDSFSGALNNEAALLDVGRETHIATVTGSVSHGPAAALKLELDGPGAGEYDQLIVNGELHLDGTLELSLGDGFAPALGQVFDVFDATMISGVFSILHLPPVPELAWDLSALYSDGQISLGLAGDFNNDGIVGIADYTVWRNSLGSTGLTPYTLGDGNGDGNITVEDYDIWKSQFGQSNPEAVAASDSAAVPEPSTLVLLLAAVCLSFWRKH